MLQDLWEKFIGFLTTYDLRTISEAIRQIQWDEAMGNPMVWLVGVPILGLLIFRKQFRLLIMAASFVIFVYLLHYAMPAPGESIPLSEMLKFLGGCVVLVAVNLYFLFVREG